MKLLFRNRFNQIQFAKSTEKYTLRTHNLSLAIYYCISNLTGATRKSCLSRKKMFRARTLSVIWWSQNTAIDLEFPARCRQEATALLVLGHLGLTAGLISRTVRFVPLWLINMTKFSYTNLNYAWTIFVRSRCFKSHFAKTKRRNVSICGRFWFDFLNNIEIANNKLMILHTDSQCMYLRMKRKNQDLGGRNRRPQLCVYASCTHIVLCFYPITYTDTFVFHRFNVSFERLRNEEIPGVDKSDNRCLCMCVGACFSQLPWLPLAALCTRVRFVKATIRIQERRTWSPSSRSRWCSCAGQTTRRSERTYTNGKARENREKIIISKTFACKRCQQLLIYLELFF